ncbi:MAG: SUF system NifU family Fe-S cluster assembly protein [bacterium]|nr:SUF system NifU family Fe-S cluster assembly protein [Deltaproteobacteria bacterium]MCP4905030.1 SUF system NifU family Fe-S cluster assembly protein [bacterium]
MDDLRELYQATILGHNKKPRNFRVMEDASHEADGHNPLCGDQFTVYARVDGEGHLEEVTFKGSGCAISKASASLMSDHVKGKALEEVQADFDRFHELVTSPPGEEPDIEGLGKLAVFAGVREYPVRVKCATLAWHALRAALEGDGSTIRTAKTE